MMIDTDIVRFCAIECRLQQSGEYSVSWMVDAWIYAMNIQKVLMANGDLINVAPTIQDVLNLGQLVEPHDNIYGFRTVNVQVGYDVKMDWQLVPGAMERLMNTIGDCTPSEFFKEYEEIHPFRDGNGRTGVILFNWLNHTLDHPVWAPNFWDDPRRTVGHGA